RLACSRAWRRARARACGADLGLPRHGRARLGRGARVVHERAARGDLLRRCGGHGAPHGERARLARSPRARRSRVSLGRGSAATRRLVRALLARGLLRALRPQRVPTLPGDDALPPGGARSRPEAAGVRVLVVTNMWPSIERPHWGAFVRSQTDSLEAA